MFFNFVVLDLYGEKLEFKNYQKRKKIFFLKHIKKKSKINILKQGVTKYVM